MTAADLKTREIVETMVGYQELVEKAVMLAFDPVAHAEGLLPLKAFQVDSRFLQKFHQLESDPSQINRMRARDILVEVRSAASEGGLAAAAAPREVCATETKAQCMRWGCVSVLLSLAGADQHSKRFSLGALSSQLEPGTASPRALLESVADARAFR